MEAHGFIEAGGYSAPTARLSQRGLFMKRRNHAFTLVELLIVIAIIGLLAAILMPMLSRARERARQSSCATNLSQIALAVQQYRQDEGRYPGSLAFLLPATQQPTDQTLYNPGGAPKTINNINCSGTTCPNPRGTGHLKSLNSIRCPNDTRNKTPYASYGDISSTGVGGPPNVAATPIQWGDSAFQEAGDISRYVWNYYGYTSDGYAYTPATTSTIPTTQLVNATLPWNPRTNPVKYSLSNRFAPTSTIITHCVFHRMQTAGRLSTPYDLYAPSAPGMSGSGALDIILRLDGSAKVVPVEPYNKPASPALSAWQNQTG
jgi:prepilin-type N-terminal cleavage/methylation domain-containing protein